MSILGPDHYKSPTVFEFEIEFSMQHRNDDDRVYYTREKKFVHVLARTLMMARATWEFDNIYPNQEHVPTILAIKPLCTIDLVCDIQRCRSF